MYPRCLISLCPCVYNVLTVSVSVPVPARCRTCSRSLKLLYVPVNVVAPVSVGARVPVTFPSLFPCPFVCGRVPIPVPICVAVSVFRNGKLCQKLEAIGYEVLEIFPGCTVSQGDIDSVPMYDLSQSHADRGVKILKQPAQQFMGFNVTNSFAFTTDCPACQLLSMRHTTDHVRSHVCVYLNRTILRSCIGTCMY
jgi:hypothetical protein